MNRTVRILHKVRILLQELSDVWLTKNIVHSSTYFVCENTSGKFTWNGYQIKCDLFISVSGFVLATDERIYLRRTMKALYPYLRSPKNCCQFTHWINSIPFFLIFKSRINCKFSLNKLLMWVTFKNCHSDNIRCYIHIFVVCFKGCSLIINLWQLCYKASTLLICPTTSFQYLE